MPDSGVHCQMFVREKTFLRVLTFRLFSLQDAAQTPLFRIEMNIYARKSHWKWYLAAGAVAIIAISLFYTRYLAQKLADREIQQAEQFAESLRSIAKTNTDTTQYNCDITLHNLIIRQNTTIPVVLFDEGWNIVEYRNLANNSDSLDKAIIRSELADMVRAGADTIEVSAPPYFRNYLVYSHSRLLRMLYWYPFVQLALIGLFILFGYLGFSAARRAEENQVWLGMAKETAHQLGTPITAIIGWVETLKSVNEESPANQEMLDELRTDVTRLELVADRFSKIGAQPELSPLNLYEILEKARDYMRPRTPRRVVLDFPAAADHPPLIVHVNAHLFDWVIENLLRNAIDAMEDGTGVITVQVYEESGYACLDLSDTGKGIPANRFKTVFKPGYSTKKRGWGLGLSLSRRIIVQYHRGKIFVKKSEPGKGSTFTIKLPKRK